jgi:hypothetical protein
MFIIQITNMGNLPPSREHNIERLINMYKRESLHKQILHISSCVLFEIIRGCENKHTLELIPKYFKLIQERNTLLIEQYLSLKYTDDEFRNLYDEVLVKSFDDIFEEYLKESV